MMNFVLHFEHYYDVKHFYLNKTKNTQNCQIAINNS